MISFSNYIKNKNWERRKIDVSELMIRIGMYVAQVCSRVDIYLRSHVVNDTSSYHKEKKESEV